MTKGRLSVQGLHTQPASCCQVSRFAPVGAERNNGLLQTDFFRLVDLDDIAILDNDVDIPVADGLDSINDLLNRDTAP